MISIIIAEQNNIWCHYGRNLVLTFWLTSV